MVLDAIPKNNRNEMGANGSNAKIHASFQQAMATKQGGAHPLLSPAFTLQSRLTALTQSFQYSQYYTINTAVWM